MGAQWRVSKRRYAYHEAGHVVMAYVTGEIVLSASILPDPDDESKGRIVLKADGSPRNRKRYLDRMMVFYAGEAAEALAFGGPTFELSQDDLRLADDLTEVAGLGLSMDDCVELYRRTEIKLKRHWPKVEAVAAALEHRGQLDAEKILGIVAPRLARSA